MGTIRKIVGDQRTDPLNSAAVINRLLEDVLSNSRLTTDGLNFPGFAHTEEGIPRVANATARDALFPSPILHQRVANDGTGYIEHWNGSAWRLEAPIGNAGPRYCPFAQGAKGDDAADDGPAITNTETSAASSGAGLAHGVGVFRSSARTFTRHHEFPPGAVVKPTSGNLVFAGGIGAGPYSIFDQSLGARVLVTGSPLGYVRAEWFKEILVTVPAPTAAPSIAAVQDTDGSGSMVAGHDYDVGYTYIGYDGGETLMSPTVTVHATTGHEVAVAQFFGTLTCRALAVAVYWQDHASPGTWRRTVHAPLSTNAGFTYTDEWGFGDMTDALGPYGVLAVFNGSFGASYPGVAAAHDKDGTVLSTPTLAPVVSLVAAVAVSTSLYGAYSYVCEDGTETALSPISAVATTGLSGGCIRMWVDSLGFPPSGAVFRNWYLGTAQNAGAMKLQLANQPLHYVFVQINSFNAGGASNTPGAAQSHVSPAQQAWDCIHDSGGKRAVLVSSPQGSKVPFIKRQTDGNATEIQLIAEGGAQSISYTGTLANVAFLIVCATETWTERIKFLDPNSRVKWCRAYGDPSGGSNFDNVWDRCTFQALAPGGIASHISNHSAGFNGHTASEQDEFDCLYLADAWAIDDHANQTGNLRRYNPKTATNGNSNSMNSGDFRCMSVTSIKMYDWFATSHGGVDIHVGDEHGYRAGGPSAIEGSCVGSEMDNGGPLFLYDSSSDRNGSLIDISQPGCLNNLGRPTYDAYIGGPSRVSLRGAFLSNNTYINNYAASLAAVVGKLGTIKRTTRFQGPFPTFPAYSPPFIAYAGGYACSNNAGKLAEPKWFNAQATIDPDNVAAGAVNVALAVAAAPVTVVVTGAVKGDKVWSVSHDQNADLLLSGVVNDNSGTVKIYASNPTGSGINLTSGTLDVWVLQRVQ